MSERIRGEQPPDGQFNLTEYARRLVGQLKAFAEKKAEVDRALADGVVEKEANAIMSELDRADQQLVQEMKRWCRSDMEEAISTARQEHAHLWTVDFASILAMAEKILVGARRLADWAQDDPLDETGAELLSNVAQEWVVLEIVLTANGIGRGLNAWHAGDDGTSAAAQCLQDLIHAVRRENAAWFIYLPILGVELLDLAPEARMGMSHSAFAKRLSVAVEILRKLQPASSARGRPGRRGYPREALAYAQELRKKNPEMKAHVIRQMCLKKFSEDDLPPDAAAFRGWLNRPRTNRTN
jgi:hypothetical protein